MDTNNSKEKEQKVDEITDFIPESWTLHKVNIAYKTNVYAIRAKNPYQILQSEPGNDAYIGSIDINDYYGHVWQFPTDKDGEMIRDASFNQSTINVDAIVKMIEAAPAMYAELQSIKKENEMLKTVLYKCNIVLLHGGERALPDRINRVVDIIDEAISQIKQS